MARNDRTEATEHDLVAAEAARLEAQRDEREAELRAETKGTVAHSLAKRRFDDAMRELAEFRRYWRQIGEVTGTRTGIAVENNTGGN